MALWGSWRSWVSDFALLPSRSVCLSWSSYPESAIGICHWPLLYFSFFGKESSFGLSMRGTPIPDLFLGLIRLVLVEIPETAISSASPAFPHKTINKYKSMTANS